MRKTTFYLLLMLITIIVGTYFYMTCCSACRLPAKVAPTKEKVIAPVTTTPKATAYPFAVNSGSFAININDNYNFDASASTILMPLSEKVTGALDSLKSFLNANPNKSIAIVGYYTADETNDTAYPNLGVARANAIKNHFVANGIPSVQINTIGKLNNEMIAKDNIYLGPVAYSITEKTDTEADELTTLYNKIKANPLVLYFDNAKTSIRLNAEQRQKIADISRYLDKVPTAQVNIVGHADNTGNKAINYRLGQERADFAKNFFVKNGIAASRINTASKGQTQPIASNATEAGRNKNRRTVVTLN